MRRGFTLIELLIVMAILGVMMAIIVISGGMVSATQLSMAAKDSLRLMRYARNMALQTQQPITLTFAPGVVTLDSPFDTASASSPPTGAETDGQSEARSEEPPRTGSALKAGDIEAVGLVKYYENVGFEFLSFDDSIKMGRASNRERADFERRVAGETNAEAGELKRQSQKTFSITVRANGTTRPFSLRIYDLEASEAPGNVVTFDFLCTGKIGDNAH